MSEAILPGIGYPFKEAPELLLLQPVEGAQKPPGSNSRSVAHPDRLPVEILCKIFESCVDQVSNGESETERVSWMKITHVSRYWREVALDHASLWSNISFIHPELAKVMLIRSRNSPLIIRFRRSESEEEPRPVLDLALSQASRLKVIEVMPGPGTPSDLEFAWVLRTIGTTAPILEKLTMWNHVRVANRYSFPKALLAGFVPALRRIEFREMDIPWGDITVCWPTRLTHFTLSFCRCGSLADIFRAMSKMASLELVHFNRCLPELSQSTIWSTSIELPQLSSLVLTDSPITLAAFFSGLKLPRIALISLSFTDASQSEVGSCLTQVKESMELVGLKGRSPAITSLGMGHIRRRREFLIDVEWCNATDIFFEPASHGDQVDITSLSSTRLSPRLELSFASGSQDVPLDRLLTLIDDAFSLTRLTTVHLAAADKKLISNECEQLFRTFARCPVLQDIHFTETPIKHFLTVLGDSEVDSSVDPGYRTPAREVFLFPALARLSFLPPRLENGRLVSEAAFSWPRQSV
ncbi:hypothetical protein FA13DRAFT_1452893 [Coprinellus micaceus]|uniref:F-box domain-containing protein n=1 Tax=Coprinellus micaceus TaxID=71717 RepID=A0A4Y7SN36_COPMI|nr:hypothetical protein FA13DRAFT_1452893 [Coprinellus micaceus]